METLYDPARSVAIKRAAARSDSPSPTCIQAAYCRRSRIAFANFHDCVSGPLIGHATPLPHDNQSSNSEGRRCSSMLVPVVWRTTTIKTDGAVNGN